MKKYEFKYSNISFDEIINQIKLEIKENKRKVDNLFAQNEAYEVAIMKIEKNIKEVKAASPTGDETKN